MDLTKTIDLSSSVALLNKIIENQATVNYYNFLQSAATETNIVSKASLITKAVEASEIMIKMFDESAFYGGHYPSLGGNAALAAVFSIFLVIQVASGVFYHQWWFLSCWTLGLTFEVLGYAGRIRSSQNIMSFNAYVMQSVCLTVAPCFLMAEIYYVIAQLAEIYGHQYSTLKPMKYSLIFIICDLISIALQGAGGGIAAGPQSTLGTNIMIGVLAFQVFKITIFLYFWYFFLYRVHEAWKISGDSAFNPKFQHVRERNLLLPFIVAISLAVLFILVRSIYRLIEMGDGWNSHLSTDEIYFMILEALMVSLASCAVSLFSPGYAYGKNAHIYIDKKVGKKNSPKDVKMRQTHGDSDYFSSDDESRHNSRQGYSPHEGNYT